MECSRRRTNTSRLTRTISVARARFRDADPVGQYVPGALERVASLGVTVENVSHVFGSVRLRYFGVGPRRGQLGRFASDQRGQRTVRRSARPESPRHDGRVQLLQLEGQRHRLPVCIPSLRRARRRRRRHPHPPGAPQERSVVSRRDVLAVRTLGGRFSRLRRARGSEASGVTCRHPTVCLSITG